MDEVSAFNENKWNELVERGVLFSRPLLNLTPQDARDYLDPNGLLGDVTGQRVLCLAGGGGRQSAAFAVLGAEVHVLDLSSAMLQSDHLVAQHYGIKIDIQQGDMRDLSRYPDASFHRVWQPFSINFVPDPRPVFAGVARILRPGGFYTLEFANPFIQGIDETEWNGQAYPLSLPYVDGAELQDLFWSFFNEQGSQVNVSGPREFRHTLSTVFNHLSRLGFILYGLWEEFTKDPEAEPGSWDHFVHYAPPWFTAWFVYRPDVIDALPFPRPAKS